ncbi:MAG: small basic family protein [Clostridium sp.]|nr:small basic family protein [Clostridium sp.]
MIAVVGLLIGVILGFVLDVNISDKFSPYMSVAILACLDSVFGAIRANLSKNFQPDIFISGFFGNSVLAALLAYLGDKLGIPIYIAAVIVFGGRIFDNFAIIRRLIIEQLKTRRKDSDKKRLRDKEKLSDI